MRRIKATSSRARSALMMMMALIASLEFWWLHWLLPTVAIVLALAGTREFVSMAQQRGLRVSFAVSIAGTTVLVCAGLVSNEAFLSALIPIILGILILSFAVHIFAHGHEDAFQAIPLNFFAPLYIGLPLALGLQILEYDKIFFLYGLIAIWSNDTAAYYTGRLMGKHKLAPSLSPKKTVEGALGGLAASIAVGLIFKTFVSALEFDIGWWQVVALGILMGVLGPIGDLGESALKRDAGVKDSGSTMTGHGGVLDRIDSVLFCFAVLYTFLILDGRI